MMKFDCIVVGQGLSGSLLTWELLRRGQRVLVLDGGKKNSASKVAIGLTNPITGKRLVKSWMIDKLLPVAEKQYKEIEKEFSQSFMHQVKIARFIPNEDIFEQWQENFQIAVNDGYINPDIQEVSFGEKHWRYFCILKSFWLDTVPLLHSMRNKFKRENMFAEHQLSYNDVKIENSEVKIGDLRAEKIIFCEGAGGNKNPFFEYLPFKLNKGQVIDVNIREYSFPEVLKKNIFIVPEESKWRIGSTYSRNFSHENPTQKALDYFRKKMKNITGKELNILNHQAAIRPATIDRRPFIGQHPVYEPFYVFNGFGSKGVSLIPYFSEHFCDYLLEGKELMEDVDNQRFLSV